MFYAEPWFVKSRLDNCYFTVNPKVHALSARIIF
jgi:hypothetical protein